MAQGRRVGSADECVEGCGVEVVANSLGCGRVAAPAADAGGAFCSAEFSASAGDLTCCRSVGSCAVTDVLAVSGLGSDGS